MRTMPIALFALCACVACGEDKPDTAEPPEADTDTDSDADSDTDTDSDADSDADADTDADTDTVPSCDVDLVENGDDLEDVTVLGEMKLPALICGDLHSSGNDGFSYLGDLDVVSFTPSEDGEVTFTLGWAETSHDIDLHLYSGHHVLDSGVTEGVDQPEQFVQRLEAGTSYLVVVSGWSGTGETAWELRLE